MDRIQFFSVNDLMYGYFLKQSALLVNELKQGRELNNINDMIEIYCAKKYLDNDIALDNWDPDDIKSYRETINFFFRETVLFFKEINDDNLLELYNEVDIEYRNDFWELVDIQEVYKHISSNKFEQLLATPKVWLYELLHHRRIVKYFGESIKKTMLKDNSSGELLVDNYEKGYDISLPKELNNEDKEIIICNYINSKNPNLNILRLIANIKRNKKFMISPKTLLRAKRKAEEIEGRLFNDGSGIKTEIGVFFSESQKEAIFKEYNNQSITLIYSSKWIKENTDYPTLLNNYIYLFGYTDLQMRCAFVSKPSLMSIYERILWTSPLSYKKGIVFSRLDATSLLQMIQYSHELNKYNIRLEEVIEWFFHIYLSNEFNGKNFKVFMPSENSTYLEKCVSIMPAMESVFKQFSLYVNEGEIDFELLEMQSLPIKYSIIPSLVKKKYVYGVGDEFMTATRLLFSDQSHLAYVEKIPSNYDSFYELICNERIRTEDYYSFHDTEINWLVDHDYILIDAEGYIVFKDKSLINLLRDLFYNEVISYWRMWESGKKILDGLEAKGIVKYESSLLSKPEQAYYNFYLNKAFNNGMELRNKYIHTQPSIINNENMHYYNYMTFLRLFIIAVIKINDDFCIAEEIRNETT